MAKTLTSPMETFCSAVVFSKQKKKKIMGGSGLDRTDDFQKFCWAGLDRIQFYWTRLDSDWKISRSAHLCSAVHDTSGITAPFSHICNWCELHYILYIFANILFMIVVASNEIWKSWSGNLNKTVGRVRSGLFKMCWILPDSSPVNRILHTSEM